MLVIVGYLATPQGRAALDRGIEEANLRGARLVVVHTEEGQRVEDTAGQRIELDRVRRRLEADGLDHEIRELARGNSPAEDLVQLADQVDADLIVIGIRRRSPVGKLVLGSNAADVILNAPCPVLSVQPPEA